MDVKAVIVTQLEVLMHRVNDSVDNVIASQALLGIKLFNFILLMRVFCKYILIFFRMIFFVDFSVINVLHINTDFRRRVASHAIAMKVVQRVSNAMHLANVHVTTMSKVAGATDAKRINSIGIKVAWIVQIAIIWFEMRQTIIVKN